MVRLEVINLLPKHQRPEVFAEKLDDVERVVEPRPVAREPATKPPCVSNHPPSKPTRSKPPCAHSPLHKPLPNPIPNPLQPPPNRLPLLLLLHHRPNNTPPNHPTTIPINTLAINTPSSSSSLLLPRNRLQLVCHAVRQRHKLDEQKVEAGGGEEARGGVGGVVGGHYGVEGHFCLLAGVGLCFCGCCSCWVVVGCGLAGCFVLSLSLGNGCAEEPVGGCGGCVSRAAGCLSCAGWVGSMLGVWLRVVRLVVVCAGLWRRRTAVLGWLGVVRCGVGEVATAGCQLRGGESGRSGRTGAEEGVVGSGCALVVANLCSFQRAQ